MRLGLSSFTYPWAIGVAGATPVRPLTAAGLLDGAARLGIRLVQIADNLPLERLPDDELRALRDHAGSLDVALEVGTRGIMPALLGRYMEIAAILGSPIIRTVVDTAEFQPTEDEILARLTPLLPELADRGITLAIENHDRFRARELVRLLNRMKSAQVAICLDTANSLGALEGPQVVFPSLAPWTVNLHIKDVAVMRAHHNLGFIVEGRPAGQGVIDIPWLLDLLRANGRDPNAIIELWPPAAPDLERTIAREREWAEQSVAYMRQFIAD
jgi:3-oxoisoapionate decarboxylase